MEFLLELIGSFLWDTIKGLVIIFLSARLEGWYRGLYRYTTN